MPARPAHLLLDGDVLADQVAENVAEAGLQLVERGAAFGGRLQQRCRLTVAGAVQQLQRRRLQARLPRPARQRGAGSLPVSRRTAGQSLPCGQITSAQYLRHAVETYMR